MRENLPEVAKYAVYILKGMPFMPHYCKRQVYVAPGYRHNKLEYTSKQLIAAGAKREYWTLWKRWRDG